VEVSGGGFSTAVHLTEGENTIHIRACDPAGNCAELSISVRMDTEPPELKIITEDGIKTKDATITIEGTASYGSNITVNGKPVELGLNGRFSATVALREGENTIVVTATDLAGNTVTKTITVYRASSSTPNGNGGGTSYNGGGFVISVGGIPLSLIIVLLIITVGIAAAAMMLRGPKEPEVVGYTRMRDEDEL